MGHISGTWELLLCEYWRKSMIIGEKYTDLKRLTERLKLRFLTEIVRLYWNQGEEVTHFAWFGETWTVVRLRKLLNNSLTQVPIYEKPPYKNLWGSLSSITFPYFVPIILLLPPWTVFACYWPIKKTSLKPFGIINWNLVGSTYGRLCIKYPQSKLKGERHRLNPLSL